MKAPNVTPAMVIWLAVGLIAVGSVGRIIVESHHEKMPQVKMQTPASSQGVLVKTQYVVISGVETEGGILPPNYSLISNGSTFGFKDGDSVPHPGAILQLNEDEGYPTAVDALRAAWLSHTRRLRLRNGIGTNAVWTVVTNF